MDETTTFTLVQLFVVGMLLFWAWIVYGIVARAVAWAKAPKPPKPIQKLIAPRQPSPRDFMTTRSIGQSPCGAG